ncbi:MAG: hypothetical protein NTZ12_08765 [Candidatus Aminicenantes bacterium]|nr:hypothetical protein [Candidatus Aminicenantes bacterium]
MKVKSFFCLFFLLAAGMGAADFSMEKAKKIEKFLERIASRRQPSLFLKKTTFSESELNSYLNLLYTKKYAPEISFIELRLRDKDEVSGSLKVKLDGEKYAAVPQFLRDIDVSFQGKFECSNYHMRYVFRELVINGSPYSPDVLDEAFNAAQINAKTKKSLFDWFTLLPGLKKVQSAEKTIFFYY